MDENSEDEETYNSNLEIEDKLPCRESEQDYIYKYIKKGLNTNGGYSTLYISGMPGTGKTACVNAMLKKLRIEYQIYCNSLIASKKKGKKSKEN